MFQVISSHLGEGIEALSEKSELVQALRKGRRKLEVMLIECGEAKTQNISCR